jgi:Heparinase II/III-like protein
MNVAFRNLTVAEIAGILSETKGRPPLPPRADRAAWAGFGQQTIAAEVLAKAEAWLGDPIPHLPVSLYLDYHRTGQRKGYEGPLDARRDRLVQLTLAECLEGKGRFLDAIHDALDATLCEPTWVIPAHGAGFQDGLPPPGLQLIDLWSAMACLLVAEVDHLLGDALHPVLRARIRRAVDERGTTPLLARDDFRWMGARETGRSSPNWAPVCAGLTAGAAIYLEPGRSRLAAVLFKALREIRSYLGTFPPDGGCAEGMGYWEKGVFALAAFAELTAARTEGRIDPLLSSAMRNVALFPFRVQMGPQTFPLFSDIAPGRTVQGTLLRHLAVRLDLPQLASVDPALETARRFTTRYPAEQIRDFLWWRDVPTNVRPAAADWLPDTGIMVARLDPDDPNGLVVAAKAGHNGEPHNHNDVGSFVIAVGSHTPVAELGAAEYTRSTFDPAQRYKALNYGSQGHSVPLVNGQTQAAGCDFAARDVIFEGDTLRMDLAPCYPSAARVRSLVRRMSLDRASGTVNLSDTAEFAGEGRFAAILMTMEEPQLVRPGLVRLGPLDVVHDPDLTVSIDVFPDLPLRQGGTFCAWRIAIAPPTDALRQQTNLVFRPAKPS